MEAEELEKRKRACSISAVALEYGRKLVKKNARMLDVCDAIDEKIRSMGAKPAFPSQISLNHIAAHYCCSYDDSIILGSQVCKLDVGAQIDGYGGDNAATVDLSNSNADLVKAVNNALYAAIKIIRPGVKLSEIGSVIQSEITALGFSPVRNLSGHGIGRFELHASPSVPNFDNGDSAKLETGQVIAVEPFATTGEGVVLESSNPEVFAQLASNPVRDATARAILKEIQSYEELPFAKRWLVRKFSPLKAEIAFRQLHLAGNLQGFPPLIEKARGLVSQAEHTLLVTDSGCEVLTKLPE